MPANSILQKPLKPTGAPGNWSDKSILSTTNVCSEKDETVVRYSVLEGSEQLFASKYKFHLPTEEELAQELRRELEAIQVEKKLNP